MKTPTQKTNEICECGHKRDRHLKKKNKSYICMGSLDCPCKKFVPQNHSQEVQERSKTPDHFKPMQNIANLSSSAPDTQTPPTKPESASLRGSKTNDERETIGLNGCRFTDKTAEKTPTLSSQVWNDESPAFPQDLLYLKDVKAFLNQVLEDIDRTIFGGLDFEQNKFVHKGIKEIIRKRAGADLI